MPPKTPSDADRPSEPLRQLSELDAQERASVRSIVRKTRYLELKLLLAEPEAHRSPKPPAHGPERPGKFHFSDPKILGIVLLAIIALVALLA